MPLSGRQIALIYMRKKTKSFQNNPNLCIFTNSFSETASEEFKSRVQEKKGKNKEKKKKKLSTCLIHPAMLPNFILRIWYGLRNLKLWMELPSFKRDSVLFVQNRIYTVPELRLSELSTWTCMNQSRKR